MVRAGKKQEATRGEMAREASATGTMQSLGPQQNQTCQDKTEREHSNGSMMQLLESQQQELEQLQLRWFVVR
jgi:hypothetical protein